MGTYYFHFLIIITNKMICNVLKLQSLGIEGEALHRSLCCSRVDYARYNILFENFNLMSNTVKYIAAQFSNLIDQKVLFNLL